ncbi:S-type Pyocin family protein [Yersinia pestis subsp. microtus bv. Caucasica]|uniref:S-type pyocin domain-containing protein n=1 Tax=Yersinia pestis TaxID=632 RepID=UPI000976B335|nr:S-type pyocin domain-containing protein [Yersinia pestis]OMK90924.1 S-type Pyocin family protein [Yersinia pestis subsp. microtus bv. Caucasica]
MAKGYYLVVGDETTCGGVITEGEPTHTIMGRAVAREQDRITCGKHPGTYIIVGHIPGDTILGRKFAGSLHSTSNCPCKARFIPSMMNDAYELIGSPTSGQSSIAPSFTETSESPPDVTPVFAKSCLREKGCTDAGTEGEPHRNFGKMGFYQTIPPSPTSPTDNNEVDQRAQTARRKPVETEPDVKTPWYKRVLGRTSAAPAAVVVPVSTGAGLAALEQAGIQGMRFVGGNLMTAGRWMGGSSPVGAAIMGMMAGTLNEGETDLLDKLKLENIAKNGGSAPTRVRFRWVDSGNGRLKAEGYHMSAEGGLDRVPVRKMTLNVFTGNYEFWEDGAAGPTILWTPNDPGFKAPSNTGNNDGPIIRTTITVLPMPEADETGEHSTTLPMPEEKDFRDYILIHPLLDLPPLHIYLSKNPDTPIWTKTKRLEPVSNAYEHWVKHGHEFSDQPFNNAKEYVESTHDFVNNPPEGTLTKTRPNGDELFYHPQLNTFAVKTKDGVPKTMFKPSDKMGYWNKQ